MLSKIGPWWPVIQLFRYSLGGFWRKIETLLCRFNWMSRTIHRSNSLSSLFRVALMIIVWRKRAPYLFLLRGSCCFDVDKGFPKLSKVKQVEVKIIHLPISPIATWLCLEVNTLSNSWSSEDRLETSSNIHKHVPLLESLHILHHHIPKQKQLYGCGS